MKKQLFLLNLDNKKFLTIYKDINSKKIEILFILILNDIFILEKKV